MIVRGFGTVSNFPTVAKEAARQEMWGAQKSCVALTRAHKPKKFIDSMLQTTVLEQANVRYDLRDEKYPTPEGSSTAWSKRHGSKMTYTNNSQQVTVRPLVAAF